MCSSMDGTQVNMDQDFTYAGEELPDDSDRSMSIFKGIGHPPLHRGCECQIMAGGGGRALVVTETRQDKPVQIDLTPVIEEQTKTLSQRIDQLKDVMSRTPEPQPPANVMVNARPDIDIHFDGNGKVKKRIKIARDEHGDITSMETVEEKVNGE